MISIILTVLTIASLLTPTAEAQITNATCTRNEDNQWLFNVNGESPCQVWSKLQSLCLPQDRYVNVPPLTDAAFAYNPPVDGGNLCQCNVVAYALMSGCTWCQLGDAGVHTSEQTWSKQCSEYNNTSTSFAQTVLPLPPYALIPLSARQLNEQDFTWSAAAAKAAYSGLPGGGNPTAVAAAAATLVPTEASTTLSRSFAPVFAPDATATASGTAKSGSPTPSKKDDEEGVKKGVPKWVPIVCGVAGGVVGLIIILLLWRYWRRRAKFEQGRRAGGEGGGDGPSTWRHGGESAVWPNAAGRGSQQEEEARRNNPYLQQNRPRRGSSSSNSSRSTRSDRTSRSGSNMSDSASEAEIVTRSGHSGEGPAASKPGGSRQVQLQPGRGVASTSPRASYEYNNARPSSQNSSHGQWGSVYPLGSKAVPINVSMMRQADAGSASDSSGRSGRKGKYGTSGDGELSRKGSMRRNTGSTFLHPRKAPRPGQSTGTNGEKGKKDKQGEDWLSYTEDDYSDEDEDGRTTDETADVSLKSPTAPTPATLPKQVAFDVPAGMLGGNKGPHQQEPLSPRSAPNTYTNASSSNSKAVSPHFAKSPLDYSSASSHAGSPRAHRTIGEGERSSKLVIANAHPGDVSMYSSPDTAAPPALLPGVAGDGPASGNGPSPLRQAAMMADQGKEAVASPAVGGANKDKEKSHWNRLKDKTKDKVKERTARRIRGDKEGEEDKGKKDKKERKERSKSGKIKKTKDGKTTTGKARSHGSAGTTMVASPNPAGLPVFGKRADANADPDNGKPRASLGIGNSRDSLQTLIRYHSPEPMSSIPPDASNALSPTSVYTHRTSHHAQSMHPFAADLHTKEPLPAFVTQPLPLPPGSKRTSPLRPRKSVNSSMKGTPRASIMGTQAGWAQVLGGRGSPSRMSASAGLVKGTGPRGKGVPIGDAGSRSQSPDRVADGIAGQAAQTGLGRSHGYPGSIDFSLPPTTPTRLPPLPDMPSPSHLRRTAGQGVTATVPAAKPEMAYRGHSEYSAHPAAPSSDAPGAPLPASLPSTKESHQMGDAYEAVDKSALHFAIARTGLAFDSDVEEQLSAGYETPMTGLTSAITPVPRDTFGAGSTPRIGVDSETAAGARSAGARSAGQAQGGGRRGMPRDSEYRAAAYRSTQGRQGERSSLAPTLPSLYEPKSAAPRWEAGDSMPSTPVKDKLDRMNRI